MMVTVRDLQKAVFPLINHCVYCGSEKGLSDEHILPYALGGKSKLRKASCTECARITGRFEQDVLRGNFWALRSHLKLSSRRKGQLPKRLPLEKLQNGMWREEDVPIEKHPVIVTFPQFVAPSILTGHHGKGITFGKCLSYGFGVDLETIIAEGECENARHTETMKPVSFARMVAKIGWCAAIAEGYEEFLDRTLADAIMAKRDDLGRWVGNCGAFLKRKRKRLVDVSFRRDENCNLIANVHLFAMALTPVYVVILGRMECSFEEFFSRRGNQ